MKKLLFTLSFALVGLSCIHAQIIFLEDFEGGDIPVGWTNQSNASDGGWKVGSPASLSSGFFGIISNGSSQIAATNDDDCDCDKSNEALITPPIDLTTNQSTVILKYEVFYGDQSYPGAQEDATIAVSADGMSWEVLEDLHGHCSWDIHVVDLSDYIGEDSVYVAFRYEDGGDWMYGFAIDNVSVEASFALDAAVLKVNGLSFGEENTSIPINGTIFNNGTEEITSLEISYTVSGGTPVVETFDNLSIPAFDYYEFALSELWIPDVADDYIVDVEITAVNGAADGNPDNNVVSLDRKIYEEIVPPNLIEEFLLAPPVLTEVADASDQLNRPTDLDFFPILGKDELWVINQRNENSGGSTLTISDASAETPTDFLHRVDGNAWHFMSLPTGIAFSSDNFNFANSPGVQDANHGGGTFTGPSLWSSDPEIYAQQPPCDLNGSHLDMLHGSPFSMGIAHEVDNVFWVYDDWNKDIVRYDFVEDHGPGNDDHSDGIVYRYKNIGIDADGDIPNHMILDKTTGWLYFVDNGNDRVMRLDINSGSISNNLAPINEALAEHAQIGGFTLETIIEEGLDRPCGIEIIENRLLVGDYANGDIIVFDMDNDFEEIGRIPTEETGLTGIKVGPDGSIWYTNRIQNSLVKAEPGEPSSTEEELFAAQVGIAPNPTSGKLSVHLPAFAAGSDIVYEISDLAGKVCMRKVGNSHLGQLDLSNLANGMYLMTVRADEFSVTKKVVLKK